METKTPSQYRQAFREFELAIIKSPSSIFTKEGIQRLAVKHLKPNENTKPETGLVVIATAEVNQVLKNLVEKILVVDRPVTQFLNNCLQDALAEVEELSVTTEDSYITEDIAFAMDKVVDMPLDFSSYTKDFEIQLDRNNHGHHYLTVDPSGKSLGTLINIIKEATLENLKKF